VRILRGTAAVAAKDLRVELRGRHGLAAALPFAITLLVSLGLALGPGRRLLMTVAPALMWIAVLFGAVLASRQAYLIEAEDGALEGLMLSPADRGAIFLGKAVAIAAQLLVIEATILVAVVLLFDLSLGAAPAALAGGFVLGTLGLAAVGVLFGVVAASSSSRESVLPLLVLPLSTPVLLAGVRTTELAISGTGGDAGSWLGLLVAFDLVVITIGFLAFGQVLEE
jgi:heme exporter protein B